MSTASARVCVLKAWELSPLQTKQQTAKFNPTQAGSAYDAPAAGDTRKEHAAEVRPEDL